MSPVTHFLFGALCGAAAVCVAVMFRRRWAVYGPPVILACGLWAELPHMVGAGGTTHWLANVCFGYAWLHPSLCGGEAAGFAVFLVVANLLLAACSAFLTWYFWTVDTVRWEQGGWEPGSRRGKRPSSERGRRR